MTKYQKYQLQWMIDHDHSLDELIGELTDLQYSDPEDSDMISQPVSDLFDEWNQDCGFGGELWACEAEWNECESRETNSAVVDAEYTSVWDGESVVLSSPCKVNLRTKKVFDIQPCKDAEDSVSVLDREAVEINGQAFPVLTKEDWMRAIADAGYFWRD